MVAIVSPIPLNCMPACNRPRSHMHHKECVHLVRHYENVPVSTMCS